MRTNVKIAQKGITVESLGAEMFLDHVTLDFIVSRDLRFLIHQMLQNRAGHALLGIIVLKEHLIHWVASLGRTMIALASLTVHHVVQDIIVHLTQQHVSWSAQLVIIVH